MEFLTFLADVAATAERGFGDPRGPVQIESERESLLAAGCMGSDWLERDGSTIRLTAKGVEALSRAKQAGTLSTAGQTAPTSPLPPASEGLLRRMADLSRSTSGSVFAALELDGEEYVDVGPLVAAGLVARSGDSYALTPAGAAMAG